MFYLLSRIMKERVPFVFTDILRVFQCGFSLADNRFQRGGKKFLVARERTIPPQLDLAEPLVRDMGNIRDFPQINPAVQPNPTKYCFDKNSSFLTTF
jgi:hypothetical protein